MGLDGTATGVPLIDADAPFPSEFTARISTSCSWALIIVECPTSALVVDAELPPTASQAVQSDVPGGLNRDS